MSLNHDIIVAPATASGGAISIIRVSGDGSIALCDRFFSARKPLSQGATHTLHYGDFCDGQRRVDDVLVSLFRAPHSYTGEESVEISCHGSAYITREILSLLIQGGARLAEPGEFTIRAYLAGRMDLSQAEAVGDVIASQSRAQATLAATQMRGGYSTTLEELRAQLISLVALLELELDFGEEDVEFASRTTLESTLTSLIKQISTLMSSFRVGNAIKEGVNVAIIGRPNAGKSTLLNQLLKEERAMVSDIAGTTRDLIEEQIDIEGVRYRFIDTAGLHTTEDRLEQMGIERTQQAISRAEIVIHLVDAAEDTPLENIELSEEQRLIVVINKMDKVAKVSEELLSKIAPGKPIYISAKSGEGVAELIEQLAQSIDTEKLYAGEPIVSSTRHYNLLAESLESLQRALRALQDGISTELLCEDIRLSLKPIGGITGGEIDTESILGHIFSSFCIGK
ncbi:MAG: tRNA uridine-5-carboxymethylaminomethyl(34) synthesis GTPase MnmE [Rikenellaceae bacterium]